MAYVFFPSCKVTAKHQESSAKLAEYLKQKLGVEPIGCCRVNHPKLMPEDTAIVICNTCAAIVEESAKVGKEIYAWQLIDNDPDFVFPNYQGEKMTVQDCWLSAERRELQDTIRSLMKKLNIEIVELEENHDKTRYSGRLLLQPVVPGSAKLAPHLYVERAADVIKPLSKEAQDDYLHKHCDQITTDKVVCYCNSCTEGITAGGKEGLHLLDLLFPV